ncbi:hypothetical protein N7V09_10890 [Shewanella seohaensis]|nr:hypothetical protein [Shewanella seohaensis]MCL1119597.1 hypothetical protein [Shewanella seohaensis]UXM80467.1 hypothetical protein N7V09_10890 [Shewanella seohaensis]
MSIVSLILLLLLASMMFFGMLSYSLGRKKTTNPKLTGMLGAVLGLFPLLGVIFLIVLVLKADITTPSMPQGNSLL